MTTFSPVRFFQRANDHVSARATRIECAAMRLSSIVFELTVGAVFFFQPARVWAQSAAPAPAQPSPTPPSAGFPLDDLPAPAPSPAPALTTGGSQDATTAVPPEHPNGHAGSPPETATAPNGIELNEASSSNRTPQFGDAGQLVITQALGASIRQGSYGNGGGSDFSFSLQSSLHYFVIEGLSLGAVLFARHNAQTIPIEDPGYGVANIETKTTNLGAALDIGANARMNKLLSIWFRGELGYSGEHSTSSEPPVALNGTGLLILGTGGHGGAFFLDFYIPFLIHPTSHFFLGIGPDMYFEKRESTPSWWSSLGVSTTMGGWF